MDEIAVALSWRFTQLRKNDGVEQIHQNRGSRIRPSRRSNSSPSVGIARSSSAKLGALKWHGRDEVVVIAAEEFRRLKGDLTGQALIAAMQASPHRDIDIEQRSVRMPVRDVALWRAGCWSSDWECRPV